MRSIYNKIVLKKWSESPSDTFPAGLRKLMRSWNTREGVITSAVASPNTLSLFTIKQPTSSHDVENSLYRHDMLSINCQGWRNKAAMANRMPAMLNWIQLLLAIASRATSVTPSCVQEA
jgi:hypothetical protein